MMAMRTGAQMVRTRRDYKAQDSTTQPLTGEDGELADLLSRVKGAAFALDDHMRIVAFNDEAVKVAGNSTADLLGKQCFDVVPASDPETGLACHEQCPLVMNGGPANWASSRTVEGPWSNLGGVGLECLLLHSQAPSNGRHTLWFIGPPSNPRSETPGQVMQAFQMLHPALSKSDDAEKALDTVLDATIMTTGAAAAEVRVFGKNGAGALQAAKGPSAEAMQALFEQTVDVSGEAGGAPASWIAAIDDPAAKLGFAQGWYVCVPLEGDGRTLGTIAVAGDRSVIDLPDLTRLLFPIGAQLSVYVRWAVPALRNADRMAEADEDSVLADSQLRVRCLGTFEVSVDGRSLTTSRFHRLKALTLLKFLVAHRGRPVPREVLVEALWPEADPVKAGANLRVVLHSLRRTLQPDLAAGQISSFVKGRGDLVYLEPGASVWVDAEEFTEAALQASRLLAEDRTDESLDTFRSASELYRVEYMEDEPYSDWCLFERERVRETYLNVMRETALIFEEQGELALAIEACRTALEADRGREEIHRHLIRLLGESGRRDEAIRQYETCRRILLEELSTEPTSETEEVYASVVSTDV